MRKNTLVEVFGTALLRNHLPKLNKKELRSVQILDIQVYR